METGTEEEDDDEATLEEEEVRIVLSIFICMCNCFSVCRPGHGGQGIVCLCLHLQTCMRGGIRPNIYNAVPTCKELTGDFKRSGPLANARSLSVCRMYVSMQIP